MTIVRLTWIRSRLDDKIMPWQWDWENYSGDNADMIGWFYPQDIAGLDTINYFRSQYKPPPPTKSG